MKLLTFFLISPIFLTALCCPIIVNADTCVTGVVEKISVGYSDYDNGNGIRVTINGKKYDVNKARNLNDSSGYALFQLLLYSKSTGTSVSLIDHKRTKCDDFDEVLLG